MFVGHGALATSNERESGHRGARGTSLLSVRDPTLALTEAAIWIGGE